MGPMPRPPPRTVTKVMAGSAPGFPRLHAHVAAGVAVDIQVQQAALARHRYNQRATAKGLGLTYDQLRHCMKKHGLGAG